MNAPPNPSTIQVWVVEDGAFLRDTIAELVQATPGMRCDLAVECCEDALTALKRGAVPDVILLDLGLPGMGGLEGIPRLLSFSPASRVVVLTVHEEDDKVFEALCAGATGYLLKPASGDRIVDAVRTAAAGGSPMNAFVARRVLDLFNRYVRPRADYGLTDREREILGHLVEERTQKEMGKALFLSPHTIDTHLRNIYAKLQVHSRTGAVAKALRERLL